jgi:3-dehydroquinate synthase
MVLAARLSALLGLSQAGDTEALAATLRRLGLSTELPQGLDPAALLARMRLDKKAAASGLRFVLWEGPGRARVLGDVPEAAVLQALQ